MITYSLAVFFLVLFPGQAEQAWPGPGDPVYVAATFTDVEDSSILAGIIVKVTVKPCERLEIVEANAKKPRWVAKYGLLTLRLEGAWVPRMNRTMESCELQISAEGEPEVKRSGGAYKLKAPKTH